MKKQIELPPVEDGLYGFDELPFLIAEAQHPEHRYSEDWIEWCAIWRDDGADGAYFRCTPPAGLRCVGLDVVEGWTVEAIELSDDEREHPDRSKWVNWRWDRQRQPAELQQRWPDGALVVVCVWSQHQAMRSASLLSEHEWYTNRLRAAALLDDGDPGRLCVLDGFCNEIDYRLGAALDRGVVHIDELNRWGAQQRPPRSFTVEAVLQPAAIQQPQRDTTAEGEPSKAPAAGPVFSMNRTALIAAHLHRWPSIAKDLKGASENGLAAAKDRQRGWWEKSALEWARAKGKLFDGAESGPTLDMAMRGLQSLPVTKHRLGR